jgi:hypothetical protein
MSKTMTGPKTITNKSGGNLLFTIGSHHLTTIPRKSVSPISASLQEGRRIKRKHVFFFIGGSAAEQAANWAAKCVSSLQLQATRLPLHSRILLSVAHHFAGHRAAIEAGEVLFHCGCEQ